MSAGEHQAQSGAYLARADLAPTICDRKRQLSSTSRYSSEAAEHSLAASQRRHDMGRRVEVDTPCFRDVWTQDLLRLQ